MALPADVTDPLAEYTVSPFVDEDGNKGLSISHDTCVWHEEIWSNALLARLVSLAFEHRITGCTTPRQRRVR